MKISTLKIFILLLFVSRSFAVQKPVKLTFEQEVLKLLEEALISLPERIKTLKPQVRTVAFYSLFADREKFSPLLLKQLQTIIENNFVKIQHPSLIFVPELKPIRIISREDKFVLSSGIRSRNELLKIAKDNFLDGLIEGDLLYSGNSLYLSLRIIEIATGEIVWSEIFSGRAPELPKQKFIDVDLGLGSYSLELSEVTKTTTSAFTIPSSLNHYVVELAFTESQPPQIKKNIRYTFRVGGFLYNRGIKTTKSTFISGNIAFFLSGFYLKTGIIFPLVENPNDRLRNYLDLSLNIGEIVAFNTTNLTVFSVGLETAITRHFSICAEYNYTPAKETELVDTKIKMGSSSYQFLVLKYRF